MAFVGAGVDDLGYLSSRVAELLLRVAEGGAKADARGVRGPAGEGGPRPSGETGGDVAPAGAGAPTEPLDAAADGEVALRRGDVQRTRARRLVGVEHDERAGFVRPLNDRLDVLDLAGLEEDVADWDEQCPLVDRLEHGGLVGDDLDVRASPSLRLVEVANRRKLALAVDDAVARRLELEA